VFSLAICAWNKSRLFVTRTLVFCNRSPSLLSLSAQMSYTKMPKEQWEARVAKGLERDRVLADRLDSGPKLIASIRFYLGALLPTGRAEHKALYEGLRGAMDKSWLPHLKAARRVLGLKYYSKSKTYGLPIDYWRHLQDVGLDVVNGLWSDLEFQQLNAELNVDERVEWYSIFHKDVLERTKAFLRGEEYQPGATGVHQPKPSKQELNAYSKHLEHHTKYWLEDWFASH
jgi:hypothetical protein